MKVSAIKLPVKTEQQFKDRELWMVRDKDGVKLTWNLTKSEADQITIALNLHDGLVSALESVRDMTDADNEKSYRADDREGCLDTCHSVAKEAIAKIKTTNGT